MEAGACAIASGWAGSTIIHRESATHNALFELDRYRVTELVRALPAILAAARKAEALQQEVAELRKALRPFAAVAEHDIGDDETDEELFRPMSSHNRAPRLIVGDLRRARTLLNGGSDAQG
ncbi:hypothetical protein EV665_102587 [Shinella granuli]|uniref:Uncharacterized protein n=2 Tax=Shinella granuli TaxID=323621 RepID=A0A4R2D113_SHIGR|nr:hypothetical protein EV665_102587 [Shinella granuli]